MNVDLLRKNALATPLPVFIYHIAQQKVNTNSKFSPELFLEKQIGQEIKQKGENKTAAPLGFNPEGCCCFMVLMKQKLGNYPLIP